MKISKGLTRQEIYATGQEIVDFLGGDRYTDASGKRRRRYIIDEEEKRHVVTFSDPKLLTDTVRIRKLKPLTKSLTVDRLVHSFPRITKYDRVSEWHDDNLYKGVWSPCIDTLILTDSIRNHGDILTEKVKTITDATAASGYIGKYAAWKCANAQELYLVDVNPNAIKCQFDNTRDLQKRKKKLRIGYFTMDARNLPEKKFDLVSVSPPYLPREDPIGYSHFEGVDLLYYMIAKGKRFLTNVGQLIITTSSLCEDITKKAIDRAKNKGLKSVEVIGEKHIPLKVLSVLNNKEWMAYLFNRGLKATNEHGYPYWHDVRILKLEYH